GLGLAIVRSVAQSHGGTVTLDEPAYGRGTRFTIRIPVDLPSPVTASNGAPDDGADDAQTSTTTGRTIGRRRNRS
ncbi:MAG TPA: ATP-binding protein, partial [Acidimicrobiales bacterium]